MDTIKQYTKHNKILKIFPDCEGGDSRSWDNLGNMVCLHGRYTLGDEHGYNTDSFTSWDDMKKYLIKEKGAIVVIPLYLYDHSGITISTKPFSCHFDSGQVGFIYATKKQIQDNFKIKNMTKKYIQKTQEILEGEVETYDKELTGEVYGFQIVEVEICKCCEHATETIKDSCWGFYGDDFSENGLFEHAGIKDISEWKELK